MRLLASLGPVKCVCRLVTTFFLLALLIFPAAAEPAPPPISGSNGLMGEWGANSSAPQTGPSTDLSGKPNSGSNDQRGTTAPVTPTESSPPSADAQDAELGSSPPSAPPNVAPPPSAQSGSNGLIEWDASSSAPQTGSSTDLSGKPISGSNDQQGTTAPVTPTESSPPSEDAQDAELGSSPPSGPQSVAPSPSGQSGSNGMIGESGTSGSASQTGSSADLNVAPSPSAQSGANESMGEWGTSGSAAQTGSSAHTSGSAFKALNGQQATVQSGTVAPAPPTEATALATSKVLVIIDKPTQNMKVFVDDIERYSWKVSSGLPGYATPSGTHTARSMNEIWYSKEWDDAPMPHAIFFTKKGHAIHGTEETKNLGRPASHGCVRLAPENARTLFALVKEKGLENTAIVLNGDAPGGASRVARTASPKQQIKRTKKSRVYAAPGRREFEKPRRFGRRGWYQRRFSYWRY